MTRLDHAALWTTAAASALNVLLWLVGIHLEAAPALIVWPFAIVSFVSFELVTLATVDGMRRGGRGRWAEASLAAPAMAALAVALEVAGVVSWPILHGAPALVLYVFARYLAQGGPRVDHLARDRDRERARADHALARVDQLEADLAALRSTPIPVVDREPLEVVQIADRVVPVRAILRELEAAGHTIPRTTFKRIVDRAVQPMLEEAEDASS